MQAAELRQQDEKELNNKLLELKREQFNLRMQQATGQFVKTHRFTQIRKEVARIKTVLRETQG